ncbi:hypothetical protein STAQ_16160 [Allostella sp. ATCC 35155]|nr:hypothetical protein STAQ_16160 [Stella sp. ATCC 35155]
MHRDLVFDVGMADGADTRFYLAKGFRVIAIEADPATAAIAREAFAPEIADGRLTILPCAVSDRDGRQTFFCNRQQPAWGSLRPHWGAGAGAVVSPLEVEAVTLPTLFARHGVPYFAKIDIEGYDALAAATLAGQAELPRYVSLELHDGSGLAALAAAGYRSFKLVNQTMLWKVRLPNPPLEGRFVPTTAWKDASGPFGRESPGREWLSLDEATAFAAAFLDLRRRQEFLVSGWLDAHARLESPGAD